MLHLKGFLALPPAFLLRREWDAVVPLMSSVTVLVFFVVFDRELRGAERFDLQKPIRFAAVGSLVFTALHALVLVNYMGKGRFRWLVLMARDGVIWVVPVLVVAVVLILYTVEIRGPYIQEADEVLRSGVRLRGTSSGTFCVDRTHYPWSTPN